jgi:hypothetical protein
MSSSLVPGIIMSESKTDFSYNAAGNVTGMKMYSDIADPGGAMDLIADYTYTYANTSINNIYIASNGAQNFALNGLPNTTTHVMTKMEMVSNATVPPMNVVITSNFVNGADNRAVSATTVTTTTGQPTQTTNYTFFYQ